MTDPVDPLTDEVLREANIDPEKYRSVRVLMNVSFAELSDIAAGLRLFRQVASRGSVPRILETEETVHAAMTPMLPMIKIDPNKSISPTL